MNAQLTPAAINPELDAFWMPFTANRQFKANPRLLARAQGMFYWTQDGREVLDGVAGLWCVNAGHGRREITEAVTKQLETMEFAPTFQMGHPLAFELANRLAKVAPPGLDRIFFTNSGSESVDTALKIAIAYHRARGAAQRTRRPYSDRAGELDELELRRPARRVLGPDRTAVRPHRRDDLRHGRPVGRLAELA